jgi:hypothetical protein
LFPFLVDFRDDDVPDDASAPTDEGTTEAADDPASRWLTAQEFARLSNTAKYQLALDRYWSKQKTRWEVGRDYERFIGYKYEMQGYAVRYHGIVEGLADFGRDLIASRDARVEVVQCKHWSSYRTVHEKHIFQLLGSALAYKIENPETQVEATFVTSTSLSDRAKEFAAQLNSVLPFNIREGERLESYPCIKCNVSHRDGERIFHLPFDQQYDAVRIEEERLECYVATIEEATKLGFRRARRWRASDGSRGSK